jgi:hypothetical protein
MSQSHVSCRHTGSAVWSKSQQQTAAFDTPPQNSGLESASFNTSAVAGVPPDPHAASASTPTASARRVLRAVPIADPPARDDGILRDAGPRGQLASGPHDPDDAVFADLRTKVHSDRDRGLLAMAPDGAFPAQPHRSSPAPVTRDRTPIRRAQRTWA